MWVPPGWGEYGTVLAEVIRLRHSALARHRTRLGIFLELTFPRPRSDGHVRDAVRLDRIDGVAFSFVDQRHPGWDEVLAPGGGGGDVVVPGRSVRAAAEPCRGARPDVRRTPPPYSPTRCSRPQPTVPLVGRPASSITCSTGGGMTAADGAQAVEGGDSPSAAV